MRKTSTIIILIMLQLIKIYGQKTVCIYEIGDSIVNYETNFENLLNNWKSNNITNANEYSRLRYAYVETITDSVRYNHYRNYYSGAEILFSAIHSESGEKDGKRYRRLIIKPGYSHSEFYDTRGMTESQKMILSEDFRQKAIAVLTRDMDVDKMNLKYFSHEIHKKDTIRGSKQSLSRYKSISEYSSLHNVASPDSISANYIDVFVLGKKKIEQLDTIEIRRLLLEQLLIERTQYQLFFNRQVQLNDKVYAVQFEFNGKPYTTYVVCSGKTKKVVMDYFFKNINVEQSNYLIRTGKGI